MRGAPAEWNLCRIGRIKGFYVISSKVDVFKGNHAIVISFWYNDQSKVCLSIFKCIPLYHMKDLLESFEYYFMTNIVKVIRKGI